MPRLAAHPGLTLGGVLALLFAWRLLAGLDAGINLSVDEAQYYLWSREPAWGYFSKPPLIAWVIAAATGVCGNSETCIRLPALLAFTATAWIVALIGRRLYDARTGLWAGIAFATLFLSSFYAQVMTTDALLLCGWALAFLLFLRALDTDRWRDWLALGAVVGIGLLAKYAMGLFLLCALLALWLERRPQLARPGFWVAVLVALAILAPNIAWNVAHQFATLRHTAEISQLDRELLHVRALANFALAQFGVMGPLLLPALLVALADRQAWRADMGHRLLTIFSLPILCLFLLLALLSRANANWAAAAYVTATVLAVAMLLRRGWRRWLYAAIALNVAMAAALYHWQQLVPALGIALRPSLDPFHAVRGWDAAGRELAEHLRATGCRAILSGSRTNLAELGYYAARARGTGVTPLAYVPDGVVKNHFDLTADIAQRPFDCALLIGGYDENRLRAEFAGLAPLPPLVLPGGEGPESVPLWRVSGFRGYAGSSGR